MPNLTLVEQFERIEKRIAAQMKLKDIICPVCKAVFSDIETVGPYVSYWGEDGQQDFECSECGAALVVEEKVTREFHVTIKDEANETTS